MKPLFRMFRSLLLCLAVGSSFAWAAEPQPVNINQADAMVLAKSLTGVGKSRAQAIVSFRDTHGPFETVDDLRKVRGVNKRIVAKNRDRIVLQ